MKIKEVNVEMINCLDNVCSTWNLTKDILGKTIDSSDAERKKLLDMQLPVGDFAVYVLRIGSSLMLRDLMLTIPGVSGWAKSLRSFAYTTSNLQLSEEVKLFLPLKSQEELYSKVLDVIKRTENGEAQDSTKQDLPILTNTDFDIVIGHRKLQNWLFTLELHAPKYFKFLYPIFEKAVPNLALSYESSSKSDILSYLHLTPAEETHEDGTFEMIDQRAVVCTIQNNLMSQFIRQHTASRKNGMYNSLVETPWLLWKQTCRDEVKVVLYTSSSSLQYLISKRACWFSQFDSEDKSSWSHLLGSAVEKMDVDEFLSSLPCGGKGCNCDIREDMVTRSTQDDVSPPCPLFIENPEMMSIRHNFYKKESRITKKWDEVCEEIYENPDNPYNLSYFNKRGQNDCNG